MRILYLDCAMGAAGDMLMAALWELLPEKQGFLDRMNGLGLPGVAVSASPCEKCGVKGTQMTVTVHGHEEGDHPHHHHHAGLPEITQLIENLPVSDRVKADALAVYRSIAEAEGRVHGAPVDQVHFHEVGALDAVADVTGVCLLMERLSPEAVYASPVHVGSGETRCAHGVLPVPAPATALLLEGIPTCGGEIAGELCTPTGAALLRHFVREFGPMPAMEAEIEGRGMGRKDFPRPNCLRAVLGRGTHILD